MIEIKTVFLYWQNPPGLSEDISDTYKKEMGDYKANKYLWNFMDRLDLKERNKVSRETLGKYFYDLSKLVFAGVAVGSVVQLTQSKEFSVLLIMITLGVFVSFVFAVVGFLILK